MTRTTVDGNEATASVAYRLNEVCCIYPITPSSPMAELADAWSNQHRPNIYGTVPTVVEMQSEGGAAGALHGALQGGALATTFTSSQGLLLMIPNMYKIAGELTSAVIHVAARSIAAQGLSIFGDHQDVMAVRQTGVALLSSASVQEAHDLALIAQAATLRTRVPFVHFFDGFRTSHELNTIELLGDDDLRALVPQRLILAHRDRALSPERPGIRGTAQNPDTYFQARETVNPFYARVPDTVEQLLGELAERTGRSMHIVDYTGHPQAERVVVLMGSGAQTAAETVAALNSRGERVGVVHIRLYRPFPAQAVLTALPPTVRAIAVLDRTKEPGSQGEPLYLDVVATLAQAYSGGERSSLPLVCGGRYGLSSKEFTPGMVAGVFEELARERPRSRFTVGIDDDVSGTSIGYDAEFDIESPAVAHAVFFGMGSDGTVGANKNTIKILGGQDHMYAQGYFVYDSKKSGSQTVSHLRFGPQPIKAPYLVQRAGFVGCHHQRFLNTVDVLGRAAHGAALLLNSSRKPERVWDSLPGPVQQQIIDKRIRLYVVDADTIAREVGLAGRINIVLQTCFFAIAGVLPVDAAIAQIKDSVAKTYAAQGADVVAANSRRSIARWPDCSRLRCRAAPPPPANSNGRFPGRPGFRAHGDRGDDRRARRRLAGQRASGGRQLSQRHRGLREAQHLRPGRGVGSRHLHPVRKLCIRVPAQRHSHHVLSAGPAAGGSGVVPVGTAEYGRPARCPLHVAGLRRGLHRMQPVRGSLPGRGPRHPGHQGDQSGAARAAGCRGTREHRVLRNAAGGQPLHGRLRDGARHPVPAAAVRIPRRLRGLR
ncbi:ferredoxin (flavodoxin) oxidoreductase [Mycobacterium kansasii]|uniref:Ferredoxin (Flavodoxin) oxidoreductase n=1 Tax=Mycobacterium kansasii TaxID=1768 RepID=A0A1V3X1M1_MYCKA|nr:ferredoxin (flavodoxin) oxidoreductase [Mycobacterium kansasii]